MKYFIIIVLFCTRSLANAQQNQWNWEVGLETAYQFKTVKTFVIQRGPTVNSPSHYYGGSVYANFNMVMTNYMQIGTGLCFAMERNHEYTAFIAPGPRDIGFGSAIQTWNYINIPFRVKFNLKNMEVQSQLNNYLAPNRQVISDPNNTTYVLDEQVTPFLIDKVPFNTHTLAFGLGYKIKLKNKDCFLTPNISYELALLNYKNDFVEIPNTINLGVKLQSNNKTFRKNK